MRGVATVALAGAVVSSGVVPGPVQAARTTTPTSPVSLPAELDWQPEYQGQVLCSPEAKPGAIKLSQLLERTYGKYTTYIPRSCATAGVSEHEEGRALDWMVDSENPTARAKAREFLSWVTAPGPDGTPGAMARRLGIMYLIYEDAMWRAYRPEDGWTEYSGCRAKQDEGYDTSCHRDHIHISLSWDGAYAATSFWTGVAETREPCGSATTSKPNGSATDPVTFINGNEGVGVAGDTCRIAARAYSSRTYSIRVPVPAGPDPVQQVLVRKAAVNSPAGVTLSSAATVKVAPGIVSGTIVPVPLASSGVITVTLGAGYGDVVLRGVGIGQPAPVPTPTPPTAAPTRSPARPAVVRMRQIAGPARVFNPVTVTGRVRRAPAGDGVVLMRRLAGTKRWSIAGGAAPAANGKYSYELLPAVKPGRYQVRAVLGQAGAVSAQTKVHEVRVAPTVVSLVQARPVAQGRGIKLRGDALGIPTKARLRVLVREIGPGKDRWRTAKARPLPSAGRYVVFKKVGRSPKLVVRTAVVARGHVLALSPQRRVQLKR